METEKEKTQNIERRGPCEDRGRDPSYEALRKAKGCQQLPEARREAWNRLPLRASERKLDLGLLALGSVRRYIYVALSYQVCDHLLWQP